MDISITPTMDVPVEITRREMLRPSSATTGRGEKAPLSPFDRVATDGYIPTVYAWAASPTVPSNQAIKEGLAAALSRFPHLAGRFATDARGLRCFLLNDAGALVLEAVAGAHLADALAHVDVAPAHIDKLYPKPNNGGEDEPLMQVQLTRYTCGGLVIGSVSHHQVSDGQSMSIFFTAWAAAVRTSGAAALPSPITDRTVVAVPRSPPAPAFDHGSIEFKGERSRINPVLPLERIRNLNVHFPEEFVARLKAHAGARCTTFQCLLAHAWKKVSAARDLRPEEFTQVRVAVNCRRRARPQQPAEYFGNMVLWAFPRLQVRELLSLSYAAVVDVIRDAVARVDDEYIQSFVDFGVPAAAAGENLQPTAEVPGASYFPHVEADSWLVFSFHDLDFGGGPPCAFLPPDIAVDGVMFFVPSCAPKGGIDLIIALDDRHIDAFKQICYGMD